MSETPTLLDDIRRTAHQRYGHYPVTLSDGFVVTLRAPLRMESDERTLLRQMQHRMNTMQDDPETTDGDLMALMRELLCLVAEGDTGQRLVDEVGDDLSVLQTLFEHYSERTQPGEASHSPA